MKKTIFMTSKMRKRMMKTVRWLTMYMTMMTEWESEMIDDVNDDDDKMRNHFIELMHNSPETLTVVTSRHIQTFSFHLIEKFQLCLHQKNTFFTVPFYFFSEIIFSFKTITRCFFLFFSPILLRNADRDRKWAWSTYHENENLLNEWLSLLTMEQERPLHNLLKTSTLSLNTESRKCAIIQWGMRFF